jgi:hypothetical protein
LCLSKMGQEGNESEGGEGVEFHFREV